MAAILQGGQYWADQAEFSVSLLAISAGVLLLAGLLTPAAALGAGLCVAGVGLPSLAKGGVNLFEAHLGAVLAMAIAAGVLLLGPGAYSVDARLFGPREIVIPPVRRSPE